MILRKLFTSRKFVVAFAALVFAFVGLCAGLLDGGQFVTVVSVTVGTFGAAHAVADHAALKNDTGQARG